MADNFKNTGKKILIVEDDVTIASELKTALEGWGYIVLGPITTGEEAMEVAAAEKPDLIFLGIVLAGEMDGIQAADIFSSTWNTPVVFLAPHAQDYLLKRAGLASPFGYINTPFDLKDLKVAIDTSLYLAQVEAERKSTEARLHSHRERLEEMVAERTRELVAINQELEKEIAERKSMAEALKGSEQNLRTLIEQAPVGILSIDNNGFVTDANPMSIRLLGSPSREATIGLNVFSLPPLVESGLSRYFKTVLETGEPQDIETPYTSIWGEHSHLRSRLVPQYDTQGKQIGLIQLLEDITQQKQAEATLQKLSQAVEQSPTSVVITDLEGCIEYVNPKFTEVTGYTYDEAIGQNPRILKSGHHDTEHYTNLWQTITSGRIWRGEILNRKKNEDLYWEFASISSVMNSKGEVTHFVAVKEDITDRKRTEEELKLAKEAAEKANKAKTDFLASMSHEIRTPMNAIIGMTDLTLQSATEPDLRDNLITIKDSANHLLSIINDILDLSKIESGKIELEKTDFDLYEDLQTALRTIEIPAANKGLELKLDISPQTPRYVSGDPLRLRQILVNLLGNAMKFTTKGGIYLSVKPITETEGIRLHFSVRDTGIGIPEDKREQIFEDFRQAEGSTTRKFGGTGLGLAICRRLVEMMGGQIGVESEFGKGSDFYFSSLFEACDSTYIPRSKHTIEDRTTQYPMALRVLLAEDNPVNAKVAYKFLTRLGYHIEIAPDGKKAIEILRRKRFDLVLMDVEMPEMDGIEATKRIRSGEAGDGNRPLPIIAMTAHVLPEFRNQAKTVGMDDFVTKPVDFNELITIIARSVTKKRRSAPLAFNDMDRRKQNLEISRREALQRLGGDSELLDELTHIFLNDVPDKRKALKKSLTISDYSAATKLAHSIKGAAGAVGIDSVQETAFRLEQAAGHRDMEAVESSFADLEKELEGVEILLGKRI